MRFSILILFLSFAAGPSITLSSDVLPLLGRYTDGSNQSLEIGRASGTSVEFDFQSVNPYRGSSCNLVGTAQSQGKGSWLYEDAADSTCTFRISVLNGNEINVVPMPTCAKAYCGAGAGLSQGVFKFIPKICMNREKIGDLSKGKKFKEAFELASKIEGSCLHALTVNQKAALFSDLSFLSLKLGEKVKCMDYAAQGRKLLLEAKPIPCTDDANRSAEGACHQNRERIKISRWIQHNAELCGTR